MNRFDEVEKKKGKRTEPELGQDERAAPGTNPKARIAFLIVLGILLLGTGISYGPRLAGAAGPRNLEVDSPDAERDYRVLRAMKFQEVRQVQQDRMKRLFELREAKAPESEIQTANEAAWRVNKVARELNRD